MWPALRAGRSVKTMADRDVPSSTSVCPESFAPLALSTISDSDPFRFEGTPIVFIGMVLAARGAGDGGTVWADANTGIISNPANAAKAASRRRLIMVFPLSRHGAFVGWVRRANVMNGKTISLESAMKPAIGL